MLGLVWSVYYSRSLVAYYVMLTYITITITDMSEVAGLSKTLETVNSELVEMMKCSEQQESDLDLLREEWLLEKNELSTSICQLTASLLKLKEETSVEVKKPIYTNLMA